MHVRLGPWGADWNDAWMAVGVDTWGRARASQLTAEDDERFVIVGSRPPREGPRGPGLREGRSGAGAGPAQRLAAAIFRRSGCGRRFAARDKIAAARRPPLALRPDAMAVTGHIDATGAPARGHRLRNRPEEIGRAHV